MAQTVVGIFDDSNEAQRAVERLTAYGFTQADIDITSQANVVEDDHDNDNDMATGRSASSSDNRDSGFGDRVGRFFSNLFDDESDAKRYSTVARKGTVVSVYAESRDEAERAADILDEFGAVNVDEKATEYGMESRSTEMGSTNQSDSSMNRNEFSDKDESNRSIPVIEEELQVGKREVQTGGMRLRSRIIERPVEESLRLREEHVRIERNPVNRPASESDLSTFREGEIEVRERAEVPVVNKQARVVEEINVRKDVEEREETVRETVRKTEVDVENLDKTTDVSTNKSKNKKKM
jgi:uncharacterized protein (TIGR02271 family)